MKKSRESWTNFDKSAVGIGNPMISTSYDRVVWSVPLFGDGLPETLWYSVPAEFGHMLTDSIDPAVLALMVPAMLKGRPLVIRGPVTEELALQLPELQSLYSATGLGQVSPIQINETVSTFRGPKGLAAGFSGGVDSFAVLAEHHYAQNVSEDLRLTHLLFNNVGSHGLGDRARSLFRARFVQASRVVERLGIPFVDVDSNLDCLDYAGRTYQATHTTRNASIAHLLNRGLGGWLYASSYPYARIGVDRESNDMSHVDPIALPLMTTAGVKLCSSGTRYDRVEKTRMIADIEDSWLSLDVCVNSSDDTQCSDCWKCRRTMLTLDILGVLERFDRRFDLEHWRQIRDGYLAAVLADTKNPFSLEIQEYISTQEVPIPPQVHVRAIGVKLHRSAIRFKKPVRQLLRTVRT